MRHTIILLALLWTIPVLGQDSLHDVKSDDGTLALFAMDKLLAAKADMSRPYLRFFDGEHISMGIYKLAAGTTDEQSPHQIDEVYYVLEGKSKFEVNGQETPVEPGDVIFVAADASHHFYDITEDLTLLVFFAKHD